MNKSDRLLEQDVGYFRLRGSGGPVEEYDKIINLHRAQSTARTMFGVRDHVIASIKPLREAAASASDVASQEAERVP